MANMIVSSDCYDGTYGIDLTDVYGGEWNGKPIYWYDGDAAYGFGLIYEDGHWMIADDYGGWFLSTCGYDADYGDEATPNLADWSGAGITVTAEGDEPEPPAKKYRYKPISQLTGRIGQLGY